MPLIPIIVALLIFVIACWIISLLPMPAGAPNFPIRLILYVLAAVVLILYLVRYV